MKISNEKKCFEVVEVNFFSGKKAKKKIRKLDTKKFEIYSWILMNKLFFMVIGIVQVLIEYYIVYNI